MANKVISIRLKDTELDRALADVYGMLKQIAREQGISVKRALYEAITLYVDNYTREVSDEQKEN